MTASDANDAEIALAVFRLTAVPGDVLDIDLGHEVWHFLSTEDNIKVSRTVTS